PHRDLGRGRRCGNGPRAGAAGVVRPHDDHPCRAAQRRHATAAAVRRRRGTVRGDEHRRGYHGSDADSEVAADARDGRAVILDVLVADDEPPALAELVAFLEADARIGAIHRASSGADALRELSTSAVDAVFLDIHMPGLGGFDLARALDRFAQRPAIVFVTADEAGALEAFDVRAVDYVLKPIRPERLRRAVDRIMAVRQRAEPDDETDEETVPVAVGQTVRLVRRGDVRWVKAEGDYSRLWTAAGHSHLVRIPISELEERWAS